MKRVFKTFAVTLATVVGITALAGIGGTDRKLKPNLDLEGNSSIKRVKEIDIKRLSSGGATPQSGYLNIYAKSDGNVYKKDESGVESPLSTNEGGAIVINKNTGFEQGTTAWSASGGTFTTTTTAADVGFGTRAGSWDASTAGQTLSGDLVDVPAGLYGKVCSLSFYYKGGDSNIKAQVYNGSGVVAESESLPTSSSYSAKQYIKFPCPSSGQLQARFYASGDAATIYLDDVRLGHEVGFNTSQSLVGGFYLLNNVSSFYVSTFTSANTWGTVSDSGIASKSYIGQGKAPTTANEFAFKLENVPAGDVEVCADVTVLCTGSASMTTAISDGTSRSAFTVTDANSAGSGADRNKVACGIFSYSTPQASVEYKLQAYTAAPSQCLIQMGPTTTESRYNAFWAKLIRSDNDLKVISIDQSGWRIDANIGGANPSLGVSSVSSYTEITDSGLDLALASGSATAEIPCSGTNASSGLTCSSGNESVGIVFTPPTAGKYEACFDFTHSVGGSTYQTFVTHQVVETPNNAQTILQEGGGKIQNSADMVSGATERIGSAKHVCGTFTFSDTSKRTLRLMYEQSVSGSPSDSLIYADRAGSAGQRDIKVSVRRLVEFQDAVKFTNLVTTSRELGLKISTVSFAGATESSACSSSPCVIYQTSGDAVSVTRAGAGLYEINWPSSFWSQKPVCVGAANSASSARMIQYDTDTSTTTVSKINTYEPSVGFNNGGASVTCVGY